MQHNETGSKLWFWLTVNLSWWLAIKFLSFIFVFVSPHNDPANEPTNEVGQKGVNNCGGDDSYNSVADDFALELVHAVSFQDSWKVIVFPGMKSEDNDLGRLLLDGENVLGHESG